MSCGCGRTRCNCGNVGFLASAIKIQNSWNVPACGQSALLNVPGCTTIMIGSYIWNPTYGAFKITAFNSVTQQITVKNECLIGNATAGTVVPACQIFMLEGAPVTAPGTGAVSAIFPYVAIDFVTPAVSACVDITVTNTNGLYADAIVQINGYSYRISTITDSTHITICNDGDGQTAGQTVSARDGSGFYQYPVSLVACTSPNWIDFSSTFGNITSSGSAPTGITVLAAQYKESDYDMIDFYASATFTIVGTPQNIYAPLPVPAYNTLYQGNFWLYIADNSGALNDGYVDVYPDTSTLRFASSHNAASFAAGAGGIIRINGRYRRA